MDSDVATRTLCHAAVNRRRIVVATDMGVVRGYLTGLDGAYMRLLAPYNNGQRATWNTCLIPRTLVIFIDWDHGLKDEPEEVREMYKNTGGEHFIDTHDEFFIDTQEDQ